MNKDDTRPLLHLSQAKLFYPTLSLSLAVECDFESGSQCGWINDHTADQEWVVHQGATSSDHTGPDNDHTKNDTDGELS